MRKPDKHFDSALEAYKLLNIEDKSDYANRTRETFYSLSFRTFAEASTNSPHLISYPDKEPNWQKIYDEQTED